MSNTEYLESSADSLARVHKAEAIGTLVRVMRTGVRDSDRIRAAETLLDRGFGKAAQAVVSIPARQAVGRQLAAMTDEQLLAIAAASRVANCGGGIAPQERDPAVRSAAAVPSSETADRNTQLVVTRSASYTDAVDADFEEIVDPLS